MSLARQRAVTLLLLALFLPAAALAQTGQPRKQPPPKKNDSSGQLETLMRQAEEAINKEDFAAAVPLLEKFIADRPEEPYAQFQLGYALSRLNRYDDAAARYRKTIELDPKFAAAYQNLGLVLLRTNRAAEAVDPLRRAVEANPDAAPLHLLLGDALEKNGDRDAALAQYKEAARLEPQSVDAHAALGRLLLESKEPAEAEKHFRAALAVDAQSARLHLGLADSLLAQHKLADAVPHLEKGIALQEPPQPALRLQLASLLYELNEHEKALAVLGAAERKAPLPPSALTLRADIFVAQNRFADAVAVMAALFTAHPQEATPELRARLGRLYMELHDYKSAQEQLLLALRAKPELTQALRDLIGAYYVSENWTGALRLLDELAKREDLAAGSWFIRAVCYDKLVMQPEALAAYKQFVALDQGRTEKQDFQARQRIKALERAIARKR